MNGNYYEEHNNNNNNNNNKTYNINTDCAIHIFTHS